MTETSQVDLLIIGNSNVSRIQAGKLYANKVCRVIKLDPLHKHIDGAIAYTKQCQITVRAKKILPSSGRVRADRSELLIVACRLRPVTAGSGRFR